MSPSERQKLKTIEILEKFGPAIVTAIVAGNYGDASLREADERQYVSADPCYVLEQAEYNLFCAAAREQRPDHYSGRNREWTSFYFRGRQVWFASCSDGVGPLNHCVDSGWVAVMPLELASFDARLKLTNAWALQTLVSKI